MSSRTSQRHLPEAGRRCDSTGRCSLPGSCTKGRPDLLRVGVVLVTDMRIRELAVEDFLGSLSSVKQREASRNWFKHIYFKSNIPGNYNIVIYINIIGSERKHYSLFGSSPTYINIIGIHKHNRSRNWALSMKRSCPIEEMYFFVFWGIQLTLLSTFEMACISRWES